MAQTLSHSPRTVRRVLAAVLSGFVLLACGPMASDAAAGGRPNEVEVVEKTQKFKGDGRKNG